MSTVTKGLLTWGDIKEKMEQVGAHDNDIIDTVSIGFCQAENVEVTRTLTRDGTTHIDLMEQAP